MGFSFLARLLRSRDSPSGSVPGPVFKGVALSVLGSFAGDEAVVTHPSVLVNLPVILDIVADADNPIYEENLVS